MFVSKRPFFPASFQSSCQCALTRVSSVSCPVSWSRWLLDQRAGVEFVKTADGWDTDFSWETSCMDPMAATCSPSNLLMMALPHHQDVMTAPSSTVPGSIPTMQGVAKLVVGDTWTLSYSTDDIVDTVLDNDPFYARVPINEEYTATLVSQLEVPPASVCVCVCVLRACFCVEHVFLFRVCLFLVCCVSRVSAWLRFHRCGGLFLMSNASANHHRFRLM